MARIILDPIVDVKPGTTVVSNTIVIPQIPNPDIHSTQVFIELGYEPDGTKNTSNRSYFSYWSQDSNQGQSCNIVGSALDQQHDLWHMLDNQGETTEWQSAITANSSEPIEFYIDLYSTHIAQHASYEVFYRKIFNKYRVYVAESDINSRALKNYKLFGSTDNINWDELDSVDNVAILPTGWTEYRTFTARNRYRSYKFYTDDHGALGTALAAIEVFEPHTVSAAGCKVIKNGQVSDSFRTICVPGDTIAVSVPAPNTPGAVLPFLVSFTNLASVPFVVVTNYNTTSGYLQEYDGLLPMDYASTYNPIDQNIMVNRHTLLNTVSHSVFTTNNMDDIPSQGVIDANTNSGLDYTFSSDFVQNKVLKTAVDTGLVVKTIAINKPYGIHYSPLAAPGTNITNTLVTSPTDNKVYVLHGESDAIIHTLTVGSKPVGISGLNSSVSGNYGFLVACFAANTVERWECVSNVFSKVATYTCGSNSGPSFIVLDQDTNKFYVTCLKSNEVAVGDATAASGALTKISLTGEPWDIVLHNSYLYVALQKESAVVAIDVSNNTTTVIPVSVFDPTFLTIVEGTSTEIWIQSLNSGEISYGELTSPTAIGTLTTGSFNISRTGQGLCTDQSKVFAANTYKDSPLRYDLLVLPMNIPNDIVIPDPSVAGEIITWVEVVSDPVAISGLDANSSELMRMPLIRGIASSLVVNGVDKGIEAVIQNGDAVAIKFMASLNVKTTLGFPIIVNNKVSLVELTTDLLYTTKRVASYQGGG